MLRDGQNRETEEPGVCNLPRNIRADPEETEQYTKNKPIHKEICDL